MFDVYCINKMEFKQLLSIYNKFSVAYSCKIKTNATQTTFNRKRLVESIYLRQFWHMRVYLSALICEHLLYKHIYDIYNGKRSEKKLYAFSNNIFLKNNHCGLN